MPEIARDLEPNAQIIEWSDDMLDIVDPYFLYYLRCCRGSRHWRSQ
jgi:hypothetical protein